MTLSSALVSLISVVTMSCTGRVWYVQEAHEPQLLLPGVMHWCAFHCFTLTWQQGRYVSQDDQSVYSVEAFSPSSVVMYRTDRTPQGPNTAVLRGQTGTSANTKIQDQISQTTHLSRSDSRRQTEACGRPAGARVC